MISALLGGIGLFLLGMTLMTNALREAADSALRDLLARFTGGPWRALLSGAAITMVVQSSSATVATTIGLVSAGLIGFIPSIGIVFGAAVGTTTTGWLVAFLGLRFSVSIIALPLVGIGALLQLLGRGAVRRIGTFLAGFGLIFVGIDTLQAGMLELSGRIDLSAVSGLSIGGQLLLVSIGVVMTIVMQSSTAAVATTLAAVFSGTVELPQALPLIIGQNLGTTSTALLASLGAAPPARRTALAHVLLNAFSGSIAFLALPLHREVLQIFAELFRLGPAEQIALFHTAINVVGVLLLMPMIGPFGRLLTRLVPEEEDALARALDPTLSEVPSVAVEAARRSAIRIAQQLARIARASLDPESSGPDPDALMRAEGALQTSRAFLSGIMTSPEDRDAYERHLGLLHALEHLDRLARSLRDRPADLREELEGGEAEIAQATMIAEGAFQRSLAWLSAGDPERARPDLGPAARRVARLRRAHRPELMARIAAGGASPAGALEQLERMRWIDRVLYHLWRAIHHLGTGTVELPGARIQPSGALLVSDPSGTR